MTTNEITQDTLDHVRGILKEKEALISKLRSDVIYLLGYTEHGMDMDEEDERVIEDIKQRIIG